MEKSIRLSHATIIEENYNNTMIPNIHVYVAFSLSGLSQKDQVVVNEAILKALNDIKIELK